MSEITELTDQLEAAQRAMIKTSINEGMQAFRRLCEHQTVIDKCRKRLEKLVGVEEAYLVWKAVVCRVAQEMPHEQDRGNSIERHEGEREEACCGEVGDKKEAYQIHGKLYLCAIREFRAAW